LVPARACGHKNQSYEEPIKDKLKSVSLLAGHFANGNKLSVKHVIIIDNKKLISNFILSVIFIE